MENYFALGSPLGLFASVYAEENFIRKSIKFCKNFYNLFHPSDLIAYRVEPVMKNTQDDDDPALIQPAVMVPCHYSAGLNQTQKLIRYFSAKDKLTFNHEQYERMKDEGRYDFVL